MYSVIDLETTGFSPARGDKVLEVAIVKVQEDNKVVDQYATLINPERDISNDHVHGIRPEHVKAAPAFRDVKYFLLSYLSGTTLVAHNASFDLRFLEHELFGGRSDGICTIKLSRLVDTSLPCRNLDFMCEYYDIKRDNSHQAFSDAVATQQLFSKLKTDFSNQYGADRFRRQFVTPVSFDPTVKSGLSRIEYRRTEALEDAYREKSKLQQLINRLPSDSLSDKEHARQYLDTLNEVLADRIITTTEMNQLEELITEFNLSRKEIRKLHKKYLLEVVKVYLLDGIISEFEQKDLTDLTQLLGLRKDDLDQLIADAKHDKTIQSVDYDFKSQVEGKSVCFTGQLQSKIDGSSVDRAMAQRMAQQRGMIIKKNVSKKLDYLVTANPNSMSGKAKKARKYGLTILAEPEFWKLVGVNVA